MTGTALLLEPRRPWPLPAALALSAGCLAAEAKVPYLLLVPVAALLLQPLCRLLLRPAGTYPPGTAPVVAKRAVYGETTLLPILSPSVRLTPAALVALALPLALLPVGYLRYRQWQEQPNPLVGYFGRSGQFSGVSDGDTLILSDPPGSRVAVAPAGEVPTGRVSVRGTLIQAEGRRNPGGFDYRDYLRRRGIHGRLLVDEVVEVRRGVSTRERLAAGAAAGLDPTGAALMKALTLGIRDDLGELRDQFSSAGMAHLLALSGLHVGILAGAAGLLFSPLGVHRYPLLLALDFAFVMIVGPSPSVVRAGIMLATVLLGLWAGAGRFEAWPVLSLSAVLTLLARPAWILDLSFLLSYGAVAGILLFASPAYRLITRDGVSPWWHPRSLLLGSMATSLAAQSLTLPLVADSFATIPLLAAFVNVLAIPIATLLVPLGFAAALAGTVSLELAALLNRITEPVAHLLLTVARSWAALPQLVWGQVTLAGLVLYLLALTAAALAVHRRLRPRRAALVVLVSMACSSWAGGAGDRAELVVIDVGQGDALLVRLPGRIEVLVDGGGTPFSDFDVGGRIVVPTLRALGVDELELVIASHSDTDHMEGLAAVLRELPVQALAYGRDDVGVPVFDELLEIARARGTRLIRVVRGHRLLLPGARLEVLNPVGGSRRSANDDSVSLRVTVEGGSRVLLLGDVSAGVEQELAPVEADVLVAPHHGSNTSSSQWLLTAASPDTVVVSAGSNGYGHPHPAVLDRVRRSGATLLVTKEVGAVRVPLTP